MIGQTIEFRVGAQTVTVTRGPASADARALTLVEARELVARIADLRVLAQLCSLADPSRSRAPEDRLGLTRELEDLLARGLLKMSARITGRGSCQAEAWIPRLAEQGEDGVEEQDRGWIEIKLEDTDGNPVPRVRYEVMLPTGELRRGYLDQEGFARIDAIPDGQCQVSFPDYDYSSWDAAS